jgi:protein required for attachment to host cells
MSMAWIVVADAARARIFSSGQNVATLKEIETLAHPEGRIHEQKLTSDLPGKRHDGSVSGHHAVGDEVEPKHQEAINFAKSIAAHLDKARAENKFSKLIFIAAPAMLGLLRDSITKETQKLLIEEIDKDLTQHSEEDIKGHLPEHIRG